MCDQRRRGAGVRTAVLVGVIGLSGCAAMGQTDSPPSKAPHRQTTKAGSAAPLPDRVAVSALRERALNMLLEATSSPEAQLRANAIEGLTRAPARLEPVLPVALKDQNVGVRTVAAMAVGKARLARLAPAVQPLLDDKSSYVRAAAVYALRANDPQADP